MTVARAGRLRSEWLLGVTGTGLFGVMFLDWFKTSGTVGEFSLGTGGLEFATDDGRRSAWQAFAFIDIALAATIVAAFTLTILAARNVRGDWARMLAGTVVALALTATVLLGVRVILSPPSLGLAPNVEVSSTPWAWIGLVSCCLLMTAGAMSLRALRGQEAEASVRNPGHSYGP